jgi:3-oxoacyl-[acyl-carrier protein] reductase
MFQQIRQKLGRLDVLVNSAASFNHTPFLDLSYEEWQQILGINLTGPFLCSQYAAQLMIETAGSGSIINISDNSGLTPWKDRPGHSVSKAGVVMLTQVSALALAPQHIRVNCVIPGPVLRPADEPDSVLESVAQGLPLGHIGNPEDIARACVFLATNDYATGTIMRIDGGEGVAAKQT